MGLDELIKGEEGNFKSRDNLGGYDFGFLNGMNPDIFEGVVNSEELKDIYENLIKNGMLEIDDNGKIIGAFVEVGGEKRPSKLFESFIKAGFSPEQALKLRLQVRTKKFKEWFGDWEIVIPKKEDTTDGVGASPVALSYLLEGGPTAIKSTGYLLHGISAAFELITNEIEGIRSKYLNQLDDNPSTFMHDNTGALKEIKDIIEKFYGQQGINILNDVLNNATGFYEREGRKISERLDELNTTIKNSLNKNISKVVDENGEPLLAYHGSSEPLLINHESVRKFNEFNACFIKGLNPYVQDFDGDYPNIERKNIITNARKNGHDLVVLKNGLSVAQDVYVVFNPDQINRI